MVIFLACTLAFFAKFANSFIHSFFSISSFGGGSMFMWSWFCSLFSIGCNGHCIVFFMVIVFF